MSTVSAFFHPEDFVPSLRQALEQEPLDLSKMVGATIRVEEPKPGRPLVPCQGERREITLTDGKNYCFWEAPPLRELFRGSQQPPVLGDYPEHYNDSFCLLDAHALDLSNCVGDRRDEEMLEVYASLRRRPDGRSLGFVHDHMWRAAAFVLGSRPLSEAEFDAIIARLERSCRTFRLGPTSRNYIAALRTTMGGVLPQASRRG